MKRIAISLTLLGAALPAWPQPPSANPKEAKSEEGRLDVRVSPFMDLFYFVGKLAADTNAKAPEIDGFTQAVEAARPLQTALRLRMLEVSRCEKAADAVQAFSQLPETARTRTGETLPLRDNAVRLAKALETIEKPFLEKIWPQHKAVIEKAAASIHKILEPKQQDCFAYLTKHLGMENANRRIPVYLVAEEPGTGGFTYIRRGGERICVVDMVHNPGSLLFEVVLHESIHALDLETQGDGNVLVEIRNQLRKAGLAETDPDFRDVPHTLMFIQAAETVRRVLDPAHKDYGEVAGYYPKVPLVAKIERPLWKDYLAGKITREEAVNRIVTEFLAARKEPLGGQF